MYPKKNELIIYIWSRVVTNCWIQRPTHTFNLHQYEKDFITIYWTVALQFKFKCTVSRLYRI